MKLSALLLSLALALPGLVLAAGPVARVTHLSGLLTATHTDGASKVLSVQSDILVGDILTTEKNSYARIKFADEAEVVLRPSTQLAVERYAYDAAKPQSDGMVLSLFKGGMRAVTGLIGKRNKEAVSFTTPTATIDIRGTHFGALFCQNDCGGVPTPNGRVPDNGLHVDVTSGAVVVSNPGGTQVFQAGQFGFVQSNTSPPVLRPPENGVQVTMPPKISQNSGSGQGIGKSDNPTCVVQ